MTKQEHLLICLAEECSEMIQAIAKIIRFGKNNIGPGMDYDNITNLNIEFNHVLAVSEVLGTLEFEIGRDSTVIDNKKSKLAHFVEYASNYGTIQQTPQIELIDCKHKVYSTSGCTACWHCPICGRRGCDNLVGCGGFTIIRTKCEHDN